LIAAFLPMAARRWTLLATAAIVCIALATAAGQAQYQMYKIGHERTRSPLAGVKSFTTPLLGDLKFANFHIKSRLGWGSFLIGGAVLLQLTAARLSKLRCGTATSEAQKNKERANSHSSASLLKLQYEI
jgi:hypothetical protein